MTTRFGRRRLLQGLAGGAVAVGLPHVWIPKAVAATSAHGTVDHLLYIRLSGGFRFTAAFNGDVDSEFNPFGTSSKKPAGVEWGVSELLDGAGWLDGEEGERRRALGMKPLSELSNEICVLPCVDHEPFSNRADGNHGTGLERWLTGYVGGSTSFLTYVNWGVRERVAEATARGEILLPAFSLGEAGMALGTGPYAAYRPPVLDGDGFDRFAFDAASSLPSWASRIAKNVDERRRLRVHESLRGPLEAYQQTREATRAYGEIFRSPLLRVGDRSDELIDGISNAELSLLLGDDGTARRMALALRLFRFGCPAVFLNQGGYDHHSGEDSRLPGDLEALNRLLSGLAVALKRMRLPKGGSFWDRTVVVLGSEFGRTTSGSRFNSAGGSDHSSDRATRWMSMPFMGGVISKANKGGRSLGSVRASDLAATGAVYSYRSVLKTLLDWLGCDTEGVFPADAPIEDFFA